MRQMRVSILILVLLLSVIPCDRAVAKGLLTVAFLDVGQGDAIYIEAPSGAQMIIDGGPAGSLLGPLSEVMPLGDRAINTIVVTNPDADHFAGFLELLDRYRVGAVIEPGTLTKTSLHADLQTKIADKKIPELLARAGMTITLDAEAGVTFTILFPDRSVAGWTTNDGSVIGVLRYGTTQIMFTGDSTKRTESILLAAQSKELLVSDILKVGHHGSTTSTSDTFLAAVAPKIAIISVGANNRYGLPKEATLAALEKAGVDILRTNEEGTIVFTSDSRGFRRAK